MDELTVLAGMREDVPSDQRYPEALRALMAEISGQAPAPSPPASARARRDRPRVRRSMLISGLVAGAVAAGTVAVVATSGEDHSGSPRARPSSAPPLRLAAVTSPRALAANAASVAWRTSVPAATQWIYLKQESMISHAPPSGAMAQVPGSHRTRETWTRVDMLYVASVRKGRTVVTSTNGGMGTPIGWPTITYSYLNSLPTGPDALLTLMRHNIVDNSPNDKATDNAVFDSVIALMENYTVLPARLNAALYGVLARLKVVHLERVKDIAGRRALSLYRIEDGMKEAILIDRASYAYAGQRRVMVADHTDHALDGTFTQHKGEILADEAILVSKIVNAPGTRS